MTHVRTQIRAEVVSRLAGLPGLSGRVQASRVYAAQKSPFIIVYTPVEEAQQDTMDRLDAHSLRQLTVRVEIYSKAGSADFEQEIDDLCALIEPALKNDPAYFPMAQTWEYSGGDISYSGDGERGGGVASLEYIFTYRVRVDDPETGV